MVMAVVDYVEGLHHDGPEPDTDVGGAHVDQAKPRQLFVTVDAHLTRGKGDNSCSGSRCFEFMRVEYIGIHKGLSHLNK